MEERRLTCIGCPMGCPLVVTMDGGDVVSVTGNTCKRGEIYGRKEVTNPTRIVTSTVRVSGGSIDMVSVKTKEDIPKGKIFDCVKALKTVEVAAPVHIGDLIMKDVAGTGVGQCLFMWKIRTSVLKLFLVDPGRMCYLQNIYF